MKSPRLQYDRVRPTITIPEGFTMIQDTREQRPLFTPASHILTRGLKTGDYSIVGFEDIIAIERKSIPDLFGSLGKNRKRFMREIKRMRTMEWSGLMIEGTESKVMRKQDYSAMEVNPVYHTLSSFEADGIHIYYAGNKRDAQDWVLSRLTKFYKHVREGKFKIP